MVDSAHEEAARFLNGLENASAKTVTRLHTITGQPTSQAVEDLASLVCDMVHAAHQTALQVQHSKNSVKMTLADDTPYNQLSGMKRIVKSQIENMDKAYHNDCVQQARKQQQNLIANIISKQTKISFPPVSASHRWVW
jgi:hypothetical protein